MNGVFEGIEKRIIIKFKKDFFSNKSIKSLLDISDESWHEILKLVGCTIISKIKEDINSSNDEKCRVYLLSESSLYIQDDVIFHKTCGKTKVLFFIPIIFDLLIYKLNNKRVLDDNWVYDETLIENNDLTEIIDFIENSLEYVFFTHMDYQNKINSVEYDQEYPHKTIEDEKKFFQFFFRSMKLVITPLPLDRNHYVFYARLNYSYQYVNFNFCSEILLFKVKKYKEKNNFHKLYLNEDFQNVFFKGTNKLKLCDEMGKIGCCNGICDLKNTEKEYTGVLFCDDVGGGKENSMIGKLSENILHETKNELTNIYIKNQEKNEIPSGKVSDQNEEPFKNKEIDLLTQVYEVDKSKFPNVNMLKLSDKNGQLTNFVNVNNLLSSEREKNLKNQIGINKSEINFLDGRCVEGINRKENGYLEISSYVPLENEWLDLVYLRVKNAESYDKNHKNVSNFSIRYIDTNLYECMNEKKESFIYNEYYFNPCGYSSNAICKDNYFCVHYSPEDLVSYASIEILCHLKSQYFVKFIYDQLNFYNGKYLYIINYIDINEANQNSSEEFLERLDTFHKEDSHKSFYVKNILCNNIAINKEQYYNFISYKDCVIDFFKVQYFVYELKNMNEQKTIPLLHDVNIMENNISSNRDSDSSNSNSNNDLSYLEFMKSLYEYSYDFCKKNEIMIEASCSFKNNNTNKIESSEDEYCKLSEKCLEKKNSENEMRKKDRKSELSDSIEKIRLIEDSGKNYIYINGEKRNIYLNGEKITMQEMFNNYKINEKDYLEIKFINNEGKNGNEIHNHLGECSIKAFDVSSNYTNATIDYENNYSDNEICDEVNECKEKKYKEDMMRFYQKNVTEINSFCKILNGDIYTSVMCINLEKILLQYIRFKKNLPNVTPFYSMKCNDEEIVIKFLYGLNVNFDCASIGEIKKLITILPTISRERIIYANTIKSIDSLIYAKNENITFCTFDNLEELKKIYKYHPNCSLLLRINVDFNNYKSYMSSKYGANEYEWADMLEFGKNHKMNIVGTSFHVGSNSKSIYDYCQAIKLSKDIWNLSEQYGYHFEILNLGGGYPDKLEYNAEKKNRNINSSTFKEEELRKEIINFLKEKSMLKKEESTENFEKIAFAINISIDYYFKDVKNKMKIICEPGRYMVGASALLAVRIIGKRHPTFKRIQLKELNGSNNVTSDNNTVINDAYGYVNEKKRDNIMENVMHIHNHIVTLNNDHAKLDNITNIKKKISNINDSRYNHYSYYVNDSIYGCFSGIIFDEYNREPAYVIKNDNPSNDIILDSSFYLSNIFGQSCDGLDMINSSTHLPECDINDWIIYENIGAYTFVSSSNFNGFSNCRKFYIFPQK